jgi:phospholipid/cholesterol/gamma-HCH transport system substrate-binding protein
MPTAAQVAWAKVRVTTMIACAIAIASVLVYLLLGGAEFLQPALTIHTSLIDLSGLEKGNPVRFNGIRVGKVTATALSHSTDPQEVVRVDMSIVRRYARSIPEDSTAVVAAENVLGDKFVDINAGKSRRHLQPDATLASPPPKQFSQADLIKTGRDILARMDSLFSDIEAGRGEFGKLFKGEEIYDSMVKKVADFQRQVRAATSKDTPAGRLIYDETAYNEIRKPLQSMDHALAELQAGHGAGGKFLKDPAQYDQLRKSVGDLNRVVADLRAGKGQAGNLLKNDELYTRVNRLVDNLNAQVNALNSGQGALGQLMTSTSLYESLNGSMKNLREGMKEFRTNPKKFLFMKVF